MAETGRGTGILTRKEGAIFGEKLPVPDPANRRFFPDRIRLPYRRAILKLTKKISFGRLRIGKRNPPKHVLPATTGSGTNTNSAVSAGQEQVTMSADDDDGIQRKLDSDHMYMPENRTRAPTLLSAEILTTS